MRFTGRTGLTQADIGNDDQLVELEHIIRVVEPEHLRDTDLASVPGPFQWWLNTYGLHTPASIVHDRFIGAPTPGDVDAQRAQAALTPQKFDTYYRHMLAATGVSWPRRWLVWSAVAIRTRSKDAGSTRRRFMYLWFLLCGVGITALVAGALMGSWAWVAASLLLPAAASVLWGSQWMAGLIIAYLGVPLVAPPTVLAAPFRLLWRFIER